MTIPFDLDDVTLTPGDHDGPDDGFCAMEAVARFAGEPWSSAPACASQVLGVFVQQANDSLPGVHRQELLRFVPRLASSRADDATEARRAWRLLDWGVRRYVPLWLQTVHQHDAAGQLAALAPLAPATTPAALRQVHAVVQAPRARRRACALVVPDAFDFATGLSNAAGMSPIDGGYDDRRRVAGAVERAVTALYNDYALFPEDDARRVHSPDVVVDEIAKRIFEVLEQLLEEPG